MAISKVIELHRGFTTERTTETTVQLHHPLYGYRRLVLPIFESLALKVCTWRNRDLLCGLVS